MSAVVERHYYGSPCPLARVVVVVVAAYHLRTVSDIWPRRESITRNPSAITFVSRISRRHYIIVIRFVYYYENGLQNWKTISSTPPRRRCTTRPAHAPRVSRDKPVIRKKFNRDNAGARKPRPRWQRRSRRPFSNSDFACSFWEEKE